MYNPINLPEMYTVIEDNGNKALEMQSIRERLDEIRMYMNNEIAFKQSIIEGQQEQISQLKAVSEEKGVTMSRLEEQLRECRQTNEGTRQLINKLLNDISNYQKDIEWYKRTYEKRSLAGTIWQKLFRK
jgi:septal ring factor EnvC (AmiA/AmiB activator)